MLLPQARFNLLKEPLEKVKRGCLDYFLLVDDAPVMDGFSDLHTHTVYSDGVLIPAELARRALVKGITHLAITDHGDSSNLDLIVPRVARLCRELNGLKLGISVIPGIELTHVPPPLIAPLVERARSMGASIVVVHGETVVEPVAPGTNRAAVEAGVDILAHPGLISVDEVELAAERGVALEITGRPGHAFTNGHVAALAREVGATCVFNTDSHQPRDLMDRNMALKVLRGCGLNLDEAEQVLANSLKLAEERLKEMRGE